MKEKTHKGREKDMTPGRGQEIEREVVGHRAGQGTQSMAEQGTGKGRRKVQTSERTDGATAGLCGKRSL